MKHLRTASVYLTIVCVFTFTEADTEQAECSIKNKLFDNHIDESLNLLNQDDPILIEAVRNMIIPPTEATVDYNFTVGFPKAIKTE